jgi:hypothetical protein
MTIEKFNSSIIPGLANYTLKFDFIDVVYYATLTRYHIEDITNNPYFEATIIPMDGSTKKFQKKTYKKSNVEFLKISTSEQNSFIESLLNIKNKKRDRRNN